MVVHIVVKISRMAISYCKKDNVNRMVADTPGTMDTKTTGNYSAEKSKQGDKDHRYHTLSKQTKSTRHVKKKRRMTTWSQQTS